ERVSLEIPTTERARSSSAPTSRPPVTARISSSAKAAVFSGMSAIVSPPLGERRAEHLAVVEGAHPVADDLVGLVTLAGDQHHVAGGGARYHRANGAGAVELDLVA